MSTDAIFYSSPACKDRIKRYVANGIWGLGTNRTFEDNAKPMAIMRNGCELVAGIIFHDYNDEAQTIELSGYASDKSWMTRGVLNKILRYPFKELCLRMVVVKFSEKNKDVLSLTKRLGCTLHTLPEVWGYKEDQIYAILKNENWKKSELYKI